MFALTGIVIRFALSVFFFLAVLGIGSQFVNLDGLSNPFEELGLTGREKPREARVVSVTDGDTLAVELGGKRVSVRLIGIDTPETKRPGVGVECGGPEAAAGLAGLVSPGDRVRLVADPSQDRRDRYGRLLRYAIADGRDLGRDQLRSGHAEVYVFAEPAFARLPGYKKASAVAEEAGRGVWGACGGDFHSGG